MKTSIIRGLLVLTLVFAFGTQATAQYGGGMSMGREHMMMWNFKAGAFFPSNRGDLNTRFNIGIEHEHPATEIIKGMAGNLTLSLDYAQFKTTTGTGSRTVGLIPIFVNWKNHYMLGQSAGQSWFWGIGVGTYWATKDIPDMRLDSGLHFAYDAALGYNFTPQWFLEGRYMASQHPSDSRIYAVDVGYSF